MTSGKTSLPTLLVEPRDVEESFRLSCLAWCLKQLGGQVSIPRSEIIDLTNSNQRITTTGDMKTDTITLSIDQSKKKGFTTPNKPAEPKPAHFQRAETVINEENE